MILLLPYLEEQALFDYFEQKEDDEIWWTVTPIFRCESDGVRYESPSLSYIPCGGVGFGSTLPKEVGFWSMDNRSLAQVTDGLSNTAFYSERMVVDHVFPNTFAEASKRHPVRVDEYFENVEQFEMECWRVFNQRDLDIVLPVSPDATILFQYTFGTRFTPNGPSCVLASEGQTPPSLDVASAAWESYTASSNHSGYVNVSFGDASVQSISDEVDPGVWRAVGTIAGQDGVFVP